MKRSYLVTLKCRVTSPSGKLLMAIFGEMLCTPCYVEQYPNGEVK